MPELDYHLGWFGFSTHGRVVDRGRVARGEEVPEMETVVPDRLREFIEQLFKASKLPETDARLCAEIAVLQEMRGVRTHGLRRVSPTLERLSNSQINPRPDRPVISDRDATVVLDGDYGVGAIGCMDAMERAIGKAGRFGIG